MSDTQAFSFSWSGSSRHFLDEPSAQAYEGMIIGRYGGCSDAGGRKNEDGALAWKDPDQDWEFAAILDGHNSSRSVELVLSAVTSGRERILKALSQPLKTSFSALESVILSIFQDPGFLESCKGVQGETSCLLTARKGKYIWWLSIGDNTLYLFHDELAAFGQFQLTSRSFYEWVGFVNTFELEVPCYSTGRKELRKGKNHILLTTDGLLECPGNPFPDPPSIRSAFTLGEIEKGVQDLLQTVHHHRGTDSATVISWVVEITQDASYASDQFKEKSV
ncbi:protein phosphatase 2C domain-containing protein [Peribacillus sp. SCS-37]|uniref:protein phosphatase 2C domain-containing protein n=1 Tax=Paraperibacillus esterisolvens TaxID=3115296 RepID=UPI0039057EB3